MNRNILCFCVLTIFGTGMPLCAQQSPVEKSTKPTKKDFRIEEERGENGRRSRIKLLSPEGKILKSFVPDDVTVAKSGKYLLHQSAYSAQEEKGYLEKEKTLYSVNGEKKWTRTFRSYPASWDPEVGDPSWGSEGISDNGDRSYFNWRDEQGNYCMGIYNEAGKELAKACRPEAIYKVEISPDGKIVGAESYLPEGSRNIKHLIFLEVDTKKTKMVRAEGEGWQGGFVLSSSPKVPRTGSVRLYWAISGAWTAKSHGEKDILFNNLPKSISVLFVSQKDEDK